MRRILFLVFLACGLVPLAASAAASTKTAKSVVPHAAKTSAAKTGNMTAAQIIDRNVAARGGLKAWRAVHTLTMSGRMEAGGKKNTALPFVMKMKRPHMSRLEIVFQGKTAMQVYDGEQGWKIRPFLGRDEVESFTPAEAKGASEWQELDGPLVDYASKGTKVVLQGTESVEGRKAYKLKLTLKNGDERHVWVDASNFLERKIDGEPRLLDGKLRNVSIFYRDYKKEKGLTMPHVLETVVDGGKQPHKMFIEHVAVNESMESALFEKPQLAVANASMQQAR
jgi:outer membrane lipoprotein-sorting protein